jgi:hypothetical protein
MQIVDYLNRATVFVRSLPARVARARKAAVPVVTGVLGALALVLGADAEIVVSLTTLAAAVGVYRAKNAPPVA